MGNAHLRIGLCLAPTWLKGQAEESGNRGRFDLDDPIELAILLAKAAEDAKLDLVFKPDYLTDAHARTVRKRQGVGVDPTLLMAAVAQATQKIGLVTTASTTFNPPYIIARQMQSLNWISRGRAGWNVVTSIEGAENFGFDAMPSPEERYRKAAEFLDVVHKLWRSAPAIGARREGAFVPVDHHGEFFKVKGPLNVPEHAEGSPVLFQAGASEIGKDFAASIADATFAATPDKQVAIDLRADLRRRAQAQGRRADDVRVLPGIYMFLAETREEAFAMHERAHAHLSPQMRFEAAKAVLGVDISHMAMSDRVTLDVVGSSLGPVRSKTHAELLRRYIETTTPTVEQLLRRPEVVGSAHWVSVGTVSDVMNEIVEWFSDGAIDGFIAIPGGSSQSLSLFLDELVPGLAAKGLFRHGYETSTLRGHLGIPAQADAVT